ncbi:MAG: hypothetical protein ACRD82_02510 [Blastocatellia bacterium]
MIRLRKASLPALAREGLKAWQLEINELPDYAIRVTEAKAKFQQRNRPDNPVFASVRASLVKMCSGARRCCYCEDSWADEVEHIQPKGLYPELVFVWANYLYVCGPCNGGKNSSFAIFSSATGGFKDVTRKKNQPVVAPESGQPVLINPRYENPLSFIELDFKTFAFRPIDSDDPKSAQRAAYTIAVLGLNTRSDLLKARHEAYGSYRDRLVAYISRRDNGASQAELQRRIKSLKRMHHPTIWFEMKRQRVLIKELNDLFAQAPEALNW